MSQLNLNIQDLFANSMQSLNTDAAALKDKIENIGDQKEMGPEQMYMLQYELGNYTAKLEAFSTITKTLTDSIKSIAQRAG